jgi:hypothetical protein
MNKITIEKEEKSIKWQAQRKQIGIAILWLPRTVLKNHP